MSAWYTRKKWGPKEFWAISCHLLLYSRTFIRAVWLFLLNSGRTICGYYFKRDDVRSRSNIITMSITTSLSTVFSLHFNSFNYYIVILLLLHISIKMLWNLLLISGRTDSTDRTDEQQIWMKTHLLSFRGIKEKHMLGTFIPQLWWQPHHNICHPLESCISCFSK